MSVVQRGATRADAGITPRPSGAGAHGSNSASPQVVGTEQFAAQPVAAAGSHVWPGVIASSVYVWNFWNPSTTVSANSVVPAGAQLTYVGWTASARTYNTQDPGSLQLTFCATAPVVRCYDVTNVPDATTTYFNDLDPAQAKFVLYCRWYNSTKTDGSALVGAGMKPYVNGSIDIGWN